MALTAAQVKKHNRETTRFLVHKLRKIPAEIMGRLTNAAALAAVTNTYQDSGRFAWNWKVQWNSTSVGGGGESYGDFPIGQYQEYRGTGRDPVVGQQAKEIGFVQTNFKRGHLYRDIVRDDPTVVRIFNPFYKGKYGEAAAEAMWGFEQKEHVPTKIEAAVARESVRVQYELRYQG